MKRATKSGLIVLILLILGVAGYTTYTILNLDKGDSAKISSSSGSYRVGADSEDFDPSVAKAYKRNFIAALYIEGTITEANQNYNQKWLINTINTLKKNAYTD